MIFFALKFYYIIFITKFELSQKLSLINNHQTKMIDKKVKTKLIVFLLIFKNHSFLEGKVIWKYVLIRILQSLLWLIDKNIQKIVENENSVLTDLNFLNIFTYKTTKKYNHKIYSLIYSKKKLKKRLQLI